MSKLIVGLGNIGEQYKNTRHNVGFKVIDSLAKKMNIILDQQKFNGIFGVGLINGEKVVIAKPLTYMNLSGAFVKAFVDYFKVNIHDLIVIYDDVSLNLGEMRLRLNGSAGGQKGMANIIELLHTDTIKRIKIGIGPKKQNVNLADFVLSIFSKPELEKLSIIINKVTNMLLHINECDFANLINFYKS